MKKIHVAQVSAYYPPTLGGAGQVVQSLSRLLADQGHEVEVFTSKNGGKPETVMPQARLTIHYLRSVVIANVPIIFPLFYRLLRLPKDSIIHLHAYQALTPEIVYIVSIIRRIPYVVTFHIDLVAESPLGVFLPIYKRVSLGRVLRRAGTVICMTSDWAEIVSEMYGVDPDENCHRPQCYRFFHIPNPIRSGNK